MNTLYLGGSADGDFWGVLADACRCEEGEFCPVHQAVRGGIRYPSPKVDDEG